MYVVGSSPPSSYGQTSLSFFLNPQINFLPSIRTKELSNVPSTINGRVNEIRARLSLYFAVIRDLRSPSAFVMATNIPKKTKARLFDGQELFHFN
jgi:hypothetical protein